MKKNEPNQEYYYQNNNGYIKNKKLSKSLKNNTKKNSPILPQQSNNYFYNTKINHLILQEISNTNRDESIYEQPGIYKNIYINNNFINKEDDISSKQSFYKKDNTSLQKLRTSINFPQNLNNNEKNDLNKEHKIGLNNFLISKQKDKNNIFSKSFLEDSNSKSNSKNKINNNNQDKDKDNYNPFQVLNYLKKRNNKNNNIMNIKNKKDKYNEKEKDDEFQKNNLSNIYLSKDETLKNSNITNIEEKTHRNNQNYFYNLEEKNFYSTNSSKKDIIMNKLSNSNDFLHNKLNIKNCRNIPLKNSKIGNYYVKSPGMSYRNVNKANNDKCQRINVEKKNGCKSPEILKKNLDLNNIKNESLNKYAYPNKKIYSSIYNGKIGFYKNNNEYGKASSINIRSNITQKKNLMNNNINNNIRNKKNNSNINNINGFNQASHNKNDSNEIKNEYVNFDFGNNSDNYMADNDKKLNRSNDAFIKVNSNNKKLNDFSRKNNEIEFKEAKVFTENRYEHSINRYYNKNKTSYNLLNDKIDKFCDILEQFFYNSFQKCFNFFIQKLNYYTEQKKSKRAIILRRLKDGKKPHKSSYINKSLEDAENNSRLLFNERKSINKEINDPKRKEKSPSKVIELQNNIKQTMMNVNQDNYIKMFNEIFKKQDRCVEDKKCRSPLLRTKTNTSILKDSLEYNNDKKYEKYSTNTNVSSFLKKSSYNKFNDLKVNMDNYDQNNINNCFDNEYDDDNFDNNSNNYIFQKSYFRSSLSNDSKRNPLNNNMNNIKTKKYINNIYANNNINRYEYDSSDGKKDYRDNSVYNDNKIFQNQKYIISNSPDTYFNKKNSDKGIYNKFNQNNQFSKNLLLYSKPLLKKPKDSNNCVNKMNIIYLKQNEMNHEANSKRKYLNTSYSTILNNMSKTPNNKYNSQKYLAESQIYNNEKYNNNRTKRKYKFNEIIIKNVSTHDKKLHVFIKYVEIGNIKKKKKYINYKLFCNHIDSITLSSMNYNSSGKKGEIKDKIYVYRNRYLNKKKDNIFREDKMFYSARNRDVFKDNKNIKGFDDDNYNNKNKGKNKKIEGEEDEQSNHQNTINNSNSFEENNNHNTNENIKDSIIYLINFLQNMFNDNKKLMIFNFFKNLKKIRTNSLLHFSMKSREKNKLKSFNNAQRKNNNNIIEISNYKNSSSSYRMTNNNSKDKEDSISVNKTINLKYDKNNSLIPKITRNKVNECNLDCIISNSKKKEKKKTLNNEILNDISNDSDSFNNKDKINNRKIYNTSYNNTNSNINSNINSTKNSIIYSKDNSEKKSSLLGDIKKLKEQVIKMKKIKEDKEDEVEINKDKNNNEITDKNNNKDKEKEKDKEKLKQIKLAKLGKIFKNLEQENNIITAIKEQFLEWSNNNDFGVKNNDKSKKGNEKGDKKYDVKTFNINHMVSSVFNSNNFEDIFKNKINIFKLQLIYFSLHGNKSKKRKKKIDNKRFIENKNRYKDNLCANRYSDFKRRRNEDLNDEEEEEDIIEIEDDKE